MSVSFVLILIVLIIVTITLRLLLLFLLPLLLWIHYYCHGFYVCYPHPLVLLLLILALLQYCYFLSRFSHCHHTRQALHLVCSHRTRLPLTTMGAGPNAPLINNYLFWHIGCSRTNVKRSEKVLILMWYLFPAKGGRATIHTCNVLGAVRFCAEFRVCGPLVIYRVLLPIFPYSTSRWTVYTS